MSRIDTSSSSHRTPLHLSIMARNEYVFNQLLQCKQYVGSRGAMKELLGGWDHEWKIMLFKRLLALSILRSKSKIKKMSFRMRLLTVQSVWRQLYLVFTLLPHFRLDLELKDHEGSTALWLAVQYITVSSDQSVNPFEDLPVVNGTSFDENSFAARLIQRGSNTNAPDTVTGKAQQTPKSWCSSLRLHEILVSVFTKTLETKRNAVMRIILYLILTVVKSLILGFKKFSQTLS